MRCEALLPAPPPPDDFSTTEPALATDPEVLVLALRMVAKHNDEAVDRWQALVLREDAAEWEQGAA